MKNAHILFIFSKHFYSCLMCSRTATLTSLPRSTRQAMQHSFGSGTRRSWTIKGQLWLRRISFLLSFNAVWMDVIPTYFSWLIYGKYLLNIKSIITYISVPDGFCLSCRCRQELPITAISGFTFSYWTWCSNRGRVRISEKRIAIPDLWNQDWGVDNKKM
jgi:hypothetical protein